MDNNYLLPDAVLPADFSWEQHQMTYDNLYFTMPTVTILCGIPTSGKSTWANEEWRKSYELKGMIAGVRLISRDELRLRIYGKNYKPSSKKEKYITEVFDRTVTSSMLQKRDIILDNTHCKESYLKEALKRFENTGYKVQVKFFDLPLWKAYYRNIKRNLSTGKWIPMNVIKAMKKNYDKINKKNYEHLVFE